MPTKLSQERARAAALDKKLAKQRHKKQAHKKGSPKRHAASLAIPRLNDLIAQVAQAISKLVRRKHRHRSKEEGLVARYIAEVNRCIGLGLHYVWGGGHGSTPSPHNGPWDCSSYATHCDQTVSPDVQTGTTFTMAGPGRGLVRGEGHYITHFIKNSPSSDAHVITRIQERRADGSVKRTRWTQCGGRDNTRPGDGPCWFEPTQSRIAEFPIQVHPVGL